MHSERKCRLFCVNRLLLLYIYFYRAGYFKNKVCRSNSFFDPQGSINFHLVIPNLGIVTQLDSVELQIFFLTGQDSQVKSVMLFHIPTGKAENEYLNECPV